MPSRLLSFALALYVSAVACCAPAVAQDRSIVVASTTSTQDSGLFGYLLPIFKAKTGIDVKVIAQGTGQALDTARGGDECLCSLRPRHLDILREPRRSGNRRRRRQAAVQPIRRHAGEPGKTSIGEERARPDIHRLAYLAGRPGRDRRLQDRRPAIVL